MWKAENLEMGVCDGTANWFFQELESVPMSLTNKVFNAQINDVNIH